MYLKALEIQGFKSFPGDMSCTSFSYVLLRLIRFCFFYLQHLTFRAA